jgi:hypothetical protein
MKLHQHPFQHQTSNPQNQIQGLLNQISRMVTYRARGNVVLAVVCPDPFVGLIIIEHSRVLPVLEEAANVRTLSPD